MYIHIFIISDICNSLLRKTISGCHIDLELFITRTL